MIHMMYVIRKHVKLICAGNAQDICYLTGLGRLGVSRQRDGIGTWLAEEIFEMFQVGLKEVGYKP